VNKEEVIKAICKGIEMLPFLLYFSLLSDPWLVDLLMRYSKLPLLTLISLLMMMAGNVVCILIVTEVIGTDIFRVLAFMGGSFALLLLGWRPGMLWVSLLALVLFSIAIYWERLERILGEDKNEEDSPLQD